eukprot:42661_1
MPFKVISQMDFYQMSIQMPIDIDHLNPYQHIQPIKPNTNLPNAHLQQLYSTCTDNSTIIGLDILYDVVINLIYYEDNEMDKSQTLFNGYSNSFIEKEGILLEDQHLKIHNKIWEYLFDTVIDLICNHIKDLINKLLSKHIFEYLLLAGGFCESNYVRYKLLKTFGIGSKYKLRIVVPRRPILQVVTGAALYCKNQCYVKSRVVRNSIGIEIRQSLNDFEYKYNEYIGMKNSNIEYEEKKDENWLLNKYENDEYIKDKIIEDKHLMNKFIDCVFHKFINCGDVINIDDAPKIQYFKPIDKDSKCIEIKLFEFQDEENEKKNENNVIGLITDDNKCKLLA